VDISKSINFILPFFITILLGLISQLLTPFVLQYNKKLIDCLITDINYYLFICLIWNYLLRDSPPS